MPGCPNDRSVRHPEHSDCCSATRSATRLAGRDLVRGAGRRICAVDAQFAGQVCCVDRRCWSRRLPPARLQSSLDAAHDVLLWYVYELMWMAIDQARGSLVEQHRRGRGSDRGRPALIPFERARERWRVSMSAGPDALAEKLGLPCPCRSPTPSDRAQAFGFGPAGCLNCLALAPEPPTGVRPPA